MKESIRQQIDRQLELIADEITESKLKFQPPAVKSQYVLKTVSKFRLNEMWASQFNKPHYIRRTN